MLFSEVATEIVKGLGLVMFCEGAEIKILLQFIGYVFVSVLEEFASKGIHYT